MMQEFLRVEKPRCTVVDAHAHTERPDSVRARVDAWDSCQQRRTWVSTPRKVHRLDPRARLRGQHKSLSVLLNEGQAVTSAVAPHSPPWSQLQQATGRCAWALCRESLAAVGRGNSDAGIERAKLAVWRSTSRIERGAAMYCLGKALKTSGHAHGADTVLRCSLRLFSTAKAPLFVAYAAFQIVDNLDIHYRGAAKHFTSVQPILEAASRALPVQDAAHPSWGNTVDDLRDKLAFCRLKNGHPEKALATFESADKECSALAHNTATLALDYGRRAMRARLHLGRCWAAMGDCDTANKLWNEASEFCHTHGVNLHHIAAAKASERYALLHG